MKKSTTSQKINQFFSAFLIFAYIVCTYFIETFLDTMADPSVKVVAQLLVFALFGLFLFYATRVGDGKPVFRFSLSTLLLVVLPAIYAIIATYSKTLPLHEVLVTTAGENMVKLASVALGYGLPFTFVSGFELNTTQESEQLPVENCNCMDNDIEGGEIKDDPDQCVCDVEDADTESVSDQEG